MIAVVVERLAERGDDLQQAHPGRAARWRAPTTVTTSIGLSRSAKPATTITMPSERAAQRSSRLSPEPAAAGRFDARTRRPARHRPPTRSRRASRPTRRPARPSCAPAPRRRRPQIPRGATSRRLARMLARIGSRKRIAPHHAVAAAVQRPRRPSRAGSRIRSSSTGKRVSRISGSVRRLLVMWVCTALVPSWSGPAPDPPAIVS